MQVEPSIFDRPRPQGPGTWPMTKEIRLNAFDMNCVGHIQHGMWTHPRDRSTEYNTIRYWQDLARLAKRGKFDGIFLADIVGVYDVYRGGPHVGQRVTLENQIRGLAVVFGVRLPRALSPAFIRQALQASEGILGLSAAMRGLVAARAAVLAAVVAIDGDIRKMARASGSCRRLMSIPGVGQLTALAFTAAVDDPGRFRRSRDIGAYLGLVPRRYQSGEVDYTGGISKCGDRRVRTLLYEAA